MSQSQTSSIQENRSERLYQIGFAILLAVSAFGMRFAPLPENFGCFGALSVFCGYVLRGGARWLIPLVGFFVADCVGHFLRTHGMGFYHVPSMVLNYLGFAAMVGTGAISKNITSRYSSQLLPWSGMVVGSLVGSILFFLISNFGAWLDPQMGYEKTIDGLVNCYMLGLPFYRATLASDLVFGCGFYAAYRAIHLALMPYWTSRRFR